MIQNDKVLIVTSYPPAWQELADITCPTHKAFADSRGWDYYADCSYITDTYYNPHTRAHERLPIKGFVKLDLFLRFWEEYRYIMWIDADALVTNHEVFLKPPRHILMPYDWNGHNATVIFNRTTGLAKQFWWACNNTGRKLFLNHDWCEMEASRYFSQTPPYDTLIEYESIKTMCGILPDEYSACVPQDIMAPYAWEPGDWILHLSALSLERRIELAKYYSKKTVTNI